MKDIRAHIVTQCKTNYADLILLSKDGSKYIKKTYTLKPGIAPEEQMNIAHEVNTSDKDEIMLINAITSKFERYEMARVIQSRVVTHVDDDDYNENNFNQYKEKLNDTIKHVNQSECELTTEELYDKYYEVQHDAFRMMGIFNHKLDDAHVLDPTLELSSAEKEIAHECWIDLLRVHRLDAFTELDELEKNTTDRDELQDIDTIKQMFRDIPQDVDLSSLTTVEQIVNFWPPLLLPVPQEIDLYRKYTDELKRADLEINEDMDTLVECLSFVTKSQITELESLHEALLSSPDVPELFLIMVQDRITELK